MYSVLVVEPQEFSRNNLLNLPVWNKNTASHQGFTCTHIASNGSEALEITKNNEIDLILTEINLTILDGLQLLKKVHVSSRPPLVVFISDIVTFAYAREGFVYGAFDYLPKPVSASDMDQLFERAATELERFKTNNSVKSISQLPGGTSVRIGQIIEEFRRRNPNSIKSFQNLLHQLYHSETLQNPDLLISKLFLELIDGIYDKNKWLSLYIPKNFHTKTGYYEMINSEDYMDFYTGQLNFLFEEYCFLRPAFKDATVSKVYLYLLEHPEEDLSLKVIAGKFFMNHTYLSSLFSKKTNDGYSGYVTKIKMKRAENLIVYSAFSFEDISYQLGYRDFRYFQTIFKKTTGKAVSEYIRNEDDNNNYSI
ncbi:MAG: response regulator [Lachnospiraceae bacterium]|nr:response regulator [Lachnospiraceae bacterium]